MKLSTLSRSFLLTIGLLLIVVVSFGANRFSITNGNWNATSTWSATSGGASGASVPVAGDIVTIEGGHNVTVTADATCASITFSQTSATSLFINAGITLNVSGTITLARSTTNSNNTLAVGAGFLNAASIIFTNGSSNSSQRHELTISTGIVTVSGDVTQYGSSGSAKITFNGSGILRLWGAFLTSTTCTFTAGTGTVEYNGGVQTVGNFTYNNLTLSGTDIKTISGVTVNGTLSMEGTASATAAPSYGPAATLQYNTTSALSAGVEWISTFTTSNGVIIKNTGVISLNSDKVLNGTLTISNGSSLALYASLSVSGNITNSGSLDSGSGNLKIGSSISGAGTFTAGTGSVEYYGSAQTVGNYIYNNLIISGGAGKTMSNGTAIIGNFLIKGAGTKAILSNGTNISTGSLTFDITNKTYGTWGSSISKPLSTYQDDTYFSNTASGILTVKQPPALNVTITASGGDVCLGSNPVLTSSGTHIMNQYWQGPNGFFSTLQNPQLTNVTSAMSGTYTVTGNTVSGVNLITNGDFESDYVGITSGYTLNTISLWAEKTYAVIANPFSLHSLFCTCPDHTSGHGKQMVINGSTMKDVSVWEQTITVIPNTNYQYSYWVQSVHEGSPARIQLTINKVLIGPPNPATLQTGTWTNIIYNWNSGTTTSATIGLINQNLDAQGNDFALDDIVFQEVSYAVSTVNVNVKPLSVGGTLSGNTTICSGTAPSTNLTLTGSIGDIVKWQKSSNVSFDTPVDIPNSNTTLTGATIGILTTTTYFRALVQSGPCSSAYSSIATIIVTPVPTAIISYPGSPFCTSLNTGQPVTLTGTGAYTGGTYSSIPTGLVIDPATGAITPGTSNPGTYTVTYTITTPCGNLAPPVTASVTITKLRIATFIYRGTTVPTFINGGVAGTFSSTPGGLNLVSSSTGEVNLSTSAPGKYTVTNTITASGGCGIVTATSPITITSYHTVAFIWTGTVSTDWNDFNNWLPGMVPDLTSDVVIPDTETTSYDPLLPLAPEAIVKTINLELNAILNGGSATTLTVAGSTYAWQNSGTFNPGTSSIKFTNADARMSGATSFNNVVIPSGAELTPQTGNLMQVSGALTLQGTGVLNANTNPNTIEYNGDDQNVITPNGSVQGYYNLILSEDGTKSFPTTPLTITGDCSLTGTATANINGATTVGGNLSIASGTIANISPAVNLTVSGSITNNNGTSGLVLQSDATGTASLMNNSNNVPATVQRYIPGAAEAWHFISSPVSNQSISGSWLPSGTYNNANGWDLYLWNEPTSCWIYKLNTTSTINWNTLHPGSNFVVGRGYLYSLQAANPTNTFVGTLNNGPITIPLTFNSIDITQKGFNLIGNPYPSSIDWQATSGWTRSILTKSGGGYDMWIWNPAAGNYGVFNSFTGHSTNGVTRYISSAQGFFVFASASGNLQMNNAARVNDQTTQFKNAKIYQGILNVKVKSDADNNFDEVMMLFGNKTNTSGSRKLFSNVLTAPSLYLPSSSEKFSVRYLTDTIDNPFIPVMFKAGQDGNYSLETNFDFNAFETVTLEDSKMHLFQNLKTDNTYRFQASKSDDPNRFAVYFGKTKITAPQKLSARVYTTGFNLVVDLSQVNKETVVKVYDIMGRMVLQNRLQANSQNNLNINPKKQILLVYLLNSDGSYFSKLLW